MKITNNTDNLLVGFCALGIDAKAEDIILRPGQSLDPAPRKLARTASVLRLAKCGILSIDYAPGE